MVDPKGGGQWKIGVTKGGWLKRKEAIGVGVKNIKIVGENRCLHNPNLIVFILNKIWVGKYFYIFVYCFYNIFLYYFI